MPDLTLHPTATHHAPPDSAGEVARLEVIITERKAELIALQDEMRAFKSRYTNIVGSRLAELAEVEREIGRAEERRMGIEAAPVDEVEAAPLESAGVRPVQTSLRRLFWSVAKMFHPDHAANEGEAARRHSIMTEASRAYREGDAESLNTLLGDDELRSYCAAPRVNEGEVDIASRVINLKEELRTVEFGIKRVRQDGLYRLKLAADEAAAGGRDSLGEMAERIGRQIEKARRRLEHLS